MGSMDKAVPGGRDIPWFTENMPVYVGPFRANIASFLEEFSKASGCVGPKPGEISMRVVQLRSEAGLLPMRVYVEKVLEETTAYCSECRCIGDPTPPPFQEKVVASADVTSPPV